LDGGDEGWVVDGLESVGGWDAMMDGNSLARNPKESKGLGLMRPYFDRALNPKVEVGASKHLHKKDH
jgi:hypothetical protein